MLKKKTIFARFRLSEMNPLFKIKAALMSAAMNKKKNEYFDVVSADLSQLDRNADPLVNNSYFFGGYGMDGSCFTMRLGQRTNGTAERADAHTI